MAFWVWVSAGTFRVWGLCYARVRGSASFGKHTRPYSDTMICIRVFSLTSELSGSFAQHISEIGGVRRSGTRKKLSFHN